MNIAVILAGGKGTRVGYDIPKQFIEVFGKPIIAYTLDEFESNDLIDAIEIVCLKAYIPLLKSIILKYNYKKVKWICEGGADFQMSVFNSVNFLKGIASIHDNLIIHFAASPFVNKKIIDDCIRVCNIYGNAISTSDFILLPTLVDDKKSIKAGKWVDREKLKCMNSPHAFKYGEILDIYNEANDKGYFNEVEPHTTSLMYFMGKNIYFSYGTQTNLKITTPEDLFVFEGYILRKEYER